MNNPNNHQRYPSQYGNPSQPQYPNQPGYPNQQYYPNQPAYPHQPGYPYQTGYPNQPGYPNPPGYPNQSGYPSPPGYPNHPPGLYQPGSSYQPAGCTHPAQNPSYPGYPIQPGYCPNPGFPQPGFPPTHHPSSNSYPIPSLRSAQNMPLQVAVEAIKNCAGAFNKDEQSLYNVLARSTSQFREQIKMEFERTHRKDLVSEFKFKYSDESRYFAHCLLYTGSELDAFILNKAMDFGFKQDIVIHILVTRSYEQFSAICGSYQKLFREDLKRRIGMKTMGSFGKLLTFLMNNPRDSGGPSFSEIGRQLDELKKGSFVKISASDNLIPIFAKSSIPHILALAESFEKDSGQSLGKYFEGYRGEYEATLKSICEFIVNQHSYFAEFLKKNIEAGIIEAVIIVACTRCEYDLSSISNCYASKYGTHLCQDISNRFGRTHPAIVEGIHMLMGIK